MIKPLVDYGINNISGSGFSINDEQAKLAAVGEAIERYSSRYFNPEELITSTYLDIKDHAFNPTHVTRHNHDQYAEVDHLQPVEESSTLNWVKTMDYLSQGSVYLPFELVYLFPSEYKPFRDIISTGLACAPGPDTETAIIGGLNECIERDAFVLFWLLRKANFKIDLKQVKDTNIKQLISKATAAHLTIELFDITQADLNVPTVLTLVKRRGKSGFYFGCATNFNYLTTIKKSLEEGLGGYGAYIESIEYYNTKVPDFKREIKQLDDHPLYYISGKNDEILEDFMFEKLEIININNLLNRDITLSAVLQNFKTLNYNVFYKDLTTLDINELDLKVVKVICPELAFLPAGPPMLNCPRIETKRKMFNVDLNLEPHPFP
ncbi:YcaO-like family protein [Alkalihalophilus pseudofirmus]|uniref:YcaO-like family protein n=1 Tax=Alkalihalophilus pseudofirmus TaxID=79885 RepID=UPI00130522B2|nr:YcaO-like family protein [Alkalihalophilus pseudofirmus]